MTMYDFKKIMYHIVNTIAKICYISLIVKMIVLFFCKQLWWFSPLLPCYIVVVIHCVILDIFFSDLNEQWWKDE